MATYRRDAEREGDPRQAFPHVLPRLNKKVQQIPCLLCISAGFLTFLSVFVAQARYQIAPIHGGKPRRYLVCKTLKKNTKSKGTLAKPRENTRYLFVLPSSSCETMQKHKQNAWRRVAETQSGRGTRDEAFPHVLPRFHKKTQQIPCLLRTSAGCRHAFCSYFLVILHDGDGIMDKNIVFSRHFATAPFDFRCFFDVFAYQTSAKPFRMYYRHLIRAGKPGSVTQFSWVPPGFAKTNSNRLKALSVKSR